MIKRLLGKSLGKWVSSCTLLLVISGCDIKTKTDIFLADLLEVVETGAELETSSQLMVEISSSNECQKTTDKLLPMLEGTFDRGVVAKGCHDEGMSSYATFRLTVPIISAQTGRKDRSTLAIVTSDSGEWHGIQMKVYVKRMNNLASMISDEFFQSVDFSTAKVSLALSNDLRRSVAVRIRDVFVDGEPIQEYKDFTLARRGVLDVSLSNVGAAMAFGKGQSKLFLFRVL